jgi:hypothetical protein
MTINDLKVVIQAKKITKWTPEECSVCDYPIHYLIKDFDNVLFDAGCNCSDIETIRVKYTRSSLKDILDHIERLTGEEKEKALKFWSV